MIENYILFSIWIVFLAIYLFFSRSGALNKPENVLIDYGDYVIARTNKLTMLFGGNQIKLVKDNVVKIQRAESSYIRFIKRDNSVISFWVPERYIVETFERAQVLLPDAQAANLKTED